MDPNNKNSEKEKDKKEHCSNFFKENSHLNNGSDSESNNCTVTTYSDPEQQNKEKRQRIITPTSPLGGILFPGLPASPPKFVSLEQIMKAANGVSNMVLAHEIAVNKDFKLEKVSLPENSLQGQVKDIVHKAFWDVLQSQLEEDPPSYAQAMILLNDVKENLLALLLPHHTRIRTQICEVLDIDLIQQQAEHGVLDFQHYAQYILSVMSGLCAPVRDARIRELMTVTDVVPLFRGITEMIDLMKLDMANFTIQQIRPHIQQHSIEYERKKFREFLETQADISENMDGLEYTRQWLKRNYQKIGGMLVKCSDASAEKVSPSITKILTASYLELLDWDDSNLFPEARKHVAPTCHYLYDILLKNLTCRIEDSSLYAVETCLSIIKILSYNQFVWSSIYNNYYHQLRKFKMYFNIQTTFQDPSDTRPSPLVGYSSSEQTLLIDQTRFLTLRDQVYQVTLVASILLITYNTIGERIQGILNFKETLKSHLTILLEGVEKCSETELQNKLQNITEQVVQETKECLKKHSAGELDKSQEEMLRGQIKDISSPSNPVYKLIKNRILTFIEEATTSATASPIKVPAGLSALQVELARITGQFLRLMSHNQSVFGEYYKDIIDTIKHAESA